jgi:adenosylcobinamide-phosphate synthase
VLVVLTLLLAGGLSWGFLLLTDKLHPLIGLIATVWLAWTCLAARELHRQSAVVVERLVDGDLRGARQALAMIVGRDTAELDEQAILRACIETVSENSSDGIVAPLFYLGLGGPVTGIVFKAVNTLDSMIGYRNERYREFGWAAARLDDLLNWLPARLTALLMIAGSAALGLNPLGGWRVMRRDARRHASPNAGFPEAVAAGALGVQLGGPACYFGQWQEKPTFGDPGQALTVVDYRRMVMLMYVVAVLMLGIACGLTWLSGEVWR